MEKFVEDVGMTGSDGVENVTVGRNCEEEPSIEPPGGSDEEVVVPMPKPLPKKLAGDR